MYSGGRRFESVLRLDTVQQGLRNVHTKAVVTIVERHDQQRIYAVKYMAARKDGQQIHSVDRTVGLYAIAQSNIYEIEARLKSKSTYVVVRFWVMAER